MTENVRTESTDPIGKFPSEDIQSVGQEIVGNILGSNSWSPSDVQNWVNSIVQQIMNHLMTKYPGQFKFVVNCVLLSKAGGAGLIEATTVCWDSSTDGSCIVRWENKSMSAIVQVFGVAVW